MADIGSLVAVRPETITALNETVKIAFGGIASVTAAVGAIYTVVSSRNNRVAKLNTTITAVNTTALETHTVSMTDAMDAHAKKLVTFSEELKTSSDEIKAVRFEVFHEIEKLKTTVLELNQSNDKNPSVGAAIEAYKKDTDEKIVILNGNLKTVIEYVKRNIPKGPNG